MTTPLIALSGPLCVPTPNNQNTRRRLEINKLTGSRLFKRKSKIHSEELLWQRKECSSSINPYIHTTCREHSSNHCGDVVNIGGHRSSSEHSTLTMRWDDTETGNESYLEAAISDDPNEISISEALIFVFIASRSTAMPERTVRESDHEELLPVFVTVFGLLEVSHFTKEGSRGDNSKTNSKTPYDAA